MARLFLIPGMLFHRTLLIFFICVFPATFTLIPREADPPEVDTYRVWKIKIATIEVNKNIVMHPAERQPNFLSYSGKIESSFLFFFFFERNSHRTTRRGFNTVSAMLLLNHPRWRIYLLSCSYLLGVFFGSNL